MTALLALLLASLPQPRSPEEEQIRPLFSGADPRSQRPWVISGELGWNGLAGIGAVVARHLDPHFTIEAGLGLSAEAAKLGARARWNFSTQEWSPFVGGGFLYGTGFGDQVFTDTSGGRAFSYTIGPSPFVQLVAGFEYQSRSGFNFLAAAGYSRLLTENIKVVTGAPTEDDLAPIRIATGSGPVLSVSFGYAF
jgi:hypothetical protein